MGKLLLQNIQSVIWANNWVHYGPTVVFIYLHYVIAIILQIYLKALNLQNACQVYSVEWVSKIKSSLSFNFYAIYRAVCFQITHFSVDDCENICVSSYYDHQIEFMNR